MKWCSALGFAVLVGCSTTDATATVPSPTSANSVAVAAPTVAAVATSPTSAAPVGSAAVNTDSATSVSPSTSSATATTSALAPAETAATQIEATLDDMYTDLEDCWAAPDNCDIDAFLNTYFAPSDDRASVAYEQVWNGLQSQGNVKVTNGRIERTVLWVSAGLDGATGRSLSCEIDNSLNVPKDTPTAASTTVPADRTTAYLWYYLEWQRQPDESWLVVHSESAGSSTPDTIEAGEIPSLTQEELAECF